MAGVTYGRTLQCPLMDLNHCPLACETSVQPLHLAGWRGLGRLPSKLKGFAVATVTYFRALDRFCWLSRHPQKQFSEQPELELNQRGGATYFRTLPMRVTGFEPMTFWV